MPVTEVLNALGSFEVTLDADTPRDVLDAIDYFGHVAIVPGRVDPRAAGEGLLDAARYVGVVRSRAVDDDRRTKSVEDSLRVGGVGMAFWLGDEDDKGAVFETAVELAGATFPNAIRALLPASGAVTEGTLYAVPGTYGGRHIYETPRAAIQYVCDTMSSDSAPVGWRVNNDATLDAGPVSDLYVTDPTCVIVKRGAGEDMHLRALPGTTGVSRDMEDYSTRVLLLAEGEGESIATASADISPAPPYRDLHGNPLRLTRLVSESDTAVQNAAARAQIALAQYASSHDELELSTTDYDVHGSFRVGDYVWVYDPDQGLVDTSNEVTFRGERISPLKLRVAETQWGVSEGYTVAYRAADGTWWDLTDYVVWESDADVRVTVGEFGRALTSAGTEPVGSRPNYDTSTPAAPQFVQPFVGSAYLDGRGFTRARVILSWIAPHNTDGSTVLDGDHYEIRWAIDTDMIYPATWTQVSQVRWMDLQTWGQPFAAPDGDHWQTMYVAWGQSTAQLQDLSPGVGYDVQIRAVDKAGNIGEWSPVTTFLASEDNVPPSTPAPPQVAASRIAVQVSHELGKASGGTFNLERDLHHLEVHVSYEPGFTPDETTLKTKVSATEGMIQAQVPVVVTVQVEETSERYVRVIAVDETGNKSGPSDAAGATALLIDDAHISDLTVSKVTAGTITASWVLAGEIKTADSGARARISMEGFELYNAGGTRTFYADADTGGVEIIGQLASGTAGQRLVINPPDSDWAQIRFYPVSGTEFAIIRSFDSHDVPDTDPSIMMRAGLGTNADYGLVALSGDRAFLGRHIYDPITDLYYAQGGSVFTNKDFARLSYLDTRGTGQYGGVVYLSADEATIGVRTGDAQESYLAFSRATGSITAVGEIAASSDPQAALIVGSMNVSGGPYTSFIRTYGPTYATTPRVIPYVWDSDASGTTIRAHMLTQNQTVGFVGTFNGSSTAAFTVYWWAWRTN